MARCPFCGETLVNIFKACKCGGTQRDKMYCPACQGVHTFTIFDGRLGCWNEACPKKVFNSKREYDEYGRPHRPKPQLPTVVVPPVVVVGPPPPPPPCPDCGYPLDFSNQYNRWYCHECRQFKYSQ